MLLGYNFVTKLKIYFSLKIIFKIWKCKILLWHLNGFINSSLFEWTMNKTISLAAIAMVAVIMGMSAFVPAAMAKPNSQSSADSGVCHFDTDTQLWEALWVNSNGQLNAHVNVHGDETFSTDAEAAFCVTNQDGTITGA